MAKVEGLDDLKAKIDSLAFETRFQIGQAVAQSAAETAAAIRVACPVNDLDPHPGALRDSVHVEPGATPFFAQVKADAKDDKGEEYGAHVEFGHRSPAFGGVHVMERPFFYPTWRLMRKRVMGRITRAIKAAARTAANG